MNIPLPPEFDLEIYRLIHPDLAGLDNDQLIFHYSTVGVAEGRRANALLNRRDFVSLISHEMRTLEIGPFTDPMITGPNVKYADYLDKNKLIERAKSFNRDFSRTPLISYVLSSMPLSEIREHFDVVFSSHCIEHQPDFVRHLTDVEGLLRDGAGRYFLVIPDKRYCFDRFNNESTIADILEAYKEKRNAHTQKSIIEHTALLSHNDPVMHWSTPHARQPSVDCVKVNLAIDMYKKCDGGYIDVHAWYFTPESFSANVRMLKSLGLINLEIERIYCTRRDSIEFWAVLKMGDLEGEG